MLAFRPGPILQDGVNRGCDATDGEITGGSRAAMMRLPPAPGASARSIGTTLKTLACCVFRIVSHPSMYCSPSQARAALHTGRLRTCSGVL
ncbi:hypothetical protein OH491_09535 [Termitidicoccus mucosus]|uniref:hypothetical protein n=1 Tax=Termitidicoccus mucosus TaxID=1184151 RepID=UPI0011AB87F9